MVKPGKFHSCGYSNLVYMFKGKWFYKPSLEEKVIKVETGRCPGCNKLLQ